MAARSCTPPRRSASPDGGTPFVCYHRLSDYPIERSNSPLTPTRNININTTNINTNINTTIVTSSQVIPNNNNNIITEPQRLSQLMTPKSSRIVGESSQPSAMLYTPQTMREELQLRASLDAELALVRLEPFRRVAPPAVTPLVEGLYVGGYPDEETLEILRKEGISVIINCCAGEFETREAVRGAFTVYDFCAEDKSDYLILFHCYDLFTEIINEARRMGRRVFVHCIAGINRSVTLCAAYIMQHYQMDPINCIRLFRAHGRTDILRNIGFRHQLVDFYFNTLSV